MTGGGPAPGLPLFHFLFEFLAYAVGWQLFRRRFFRHRLGLISIAILGVLQNGFALLQYSVYTQYIVQGGLLIFAVLTDQLVRRAER